jgi:hypothetical protein
VSYRIRKGRLLFWFVVAVVGLVAAIVVGWGHGATGNAPKEPGRAQQTTR